MNKKEQHSIFGTFLTKTTCNKCGGVGHTYDKTCTKCKGDGRVRVSKELEIKVPSGVDTGTKLKLSGKGSS